MEIEELYDLQDALEQYTRKQSLEIHGIPESAYTSTEDAVLKVAQALDVPITADDIDISHKLNGKGEKSILVKFTSHKAKTKLYKKRTSLKRAKDCGSLPRSVGCNTCGREKIFINKNLTSFRRDLVKKANEKRVDGLLLSVWTLDAKIFVKTSPDGRPIRIYDHSDLNTLKSLISNPQSLLTTAQFT